MIVKFFSTLPTLENGPNKGYEQYEDYGFVDQYIIMFTALYIKSQIYIKHLYYGFFLKRREKPWKDST